MRKTGLRARVSFIFIFTVAAILVFVSISLIFETHYHFLMYQNQSMGMTHDFSQLIYHLEQALIQSIVWTFLVALLLTIGISLYIAKRVSAPLITMKHVAEKMTHGHLESRSNIKGNDELADLGASLNRLAEQLQNQEHLRKIMTQDIAHELRTPLATLKSHMQAFQDGVWQPTPSRIQACYEEIERLIRLVADLEQLTHIESSQFRLSLKQEDISKLIQHGVSVVSAAYMQKNVQLIVKSAPSIIIQVDKERLIQVLVNLLSNALEFTPENRYVEIKATDKGESVLITVSDTGSGISPKDLPYVFERFYRGDKSRNRKSGGGGIGLTIVKKIVEAHHGSVWIESNHGTIVYIQLPKNLD